MIFDTDESEVQSGISLFQKDDNYFTYTIERQNREYLLKLILKEKNSEPTTIKDKILSSYNGSVIFKVVSDDMAYRFYYSLDESKKFNFLTEIGPNKILSKGYTGAYFGLYSTTNGKDIQEHADFDWVMLK